ncbi:MAG TPA: MFS transporter [Dermatophilaceae bacterium]|nr:MFS transporter [Dermatophilaceae bacterium]
MRAYLAVLAVGDARRIVVALALTRLGYGMIGLAVVLLAYDVTGSFAIAGLAVGVFTLASGVLAPLRGSLVDRYGQTRPLVVYVPLYTLFCLALSVATSPALIVLLAGLAGAASPPLIASARPLWAGIVGEDLLRPAYALDSVSMQTTQVIGPALAGLLAAATSPRLAVAALAVLVAAGGALFMTSRPSRTWRSEARVGGHGALASRGLRTLLWSGASFGCAIGAIEVGLPALTALTGSAVDATPYLMVLAAGSVIGGVAAGLNRRRGPAGMFLLSLTAIVPLIVPLLILGPGLALVAVLLAIGLVLGPVNIAWYELLDRVAPPGTAVTAFTWVVSAELAGVAAGQALAGWAAEGFSVSLSFGVALLAAASGAAVGLARRTTLREAYVPADSGAS